MLTLFLRKEPTRDQYSIDHGLKRNDTVYYRDAACTDMAMIQPWHYSGHPRKNSKTCMFNCYRWLVQWVE